MILVSLNKSSNLRILYFSTFSFALKKLSNSFIIDSVNSIFFKSNSSTKLFKNDVSSIFPDFNKTFIIISIYIFSKITFSILSYNKLYFFISSNLFKHFSLISFNESSFSSIYSSEFR